MAEIGELIEMARAFDAREVPPPTSTGESDAVGQAAVDRALVSLSRRKCGVLLTGPLSPPPHLGGVENGVALLLSSGLASLVKMQLFNTARVPDPTRRLHHRVLFQLSMYVRFIATLARLRPRIVHIKTSSGINFYQNSLYMLIARLLGRRVVLQVHSGHFLDFYRNAGRIRRACIRGALRSPHVLVGLSEAWARLLKEIRGPGGVVVVPNALDAEQFALSRGDRGRFGIPLDRIVALFIGTRDRQMDEQKGLPVLIEATAEVRRRHPELLLVLAGPSCAQEDFRPLLGARGDGWLTVGVVSGDAKQTLYRSVDLFVLPSLAENMPNSLLEAMATGLPVVATRVGAIPEMITDGENGLLVARGSRAELVEGMVRLVSDSGLRSRLGPRAAETVRGHYTLAVLEAKLGHLYAGLAN